MSIKILPYKPGLESARVLAFELDAKRINVVNPTYMPKSNKTFIINWGNSSDYAQEVYNHSKRFINKPEAVKIAQNKLESYKRFPEAICPLFTTDKAVAQAWLNEGKTILVRRMLRASQGQGIEIYERSLNNTPNLPNAPLYVQYIPKKEEYRVHVAFGNVIDVQQKKVRTEFEEEVNYKVRNLENGWVFCRENITTPEQVLAAGLSAVLSLALDFGAVDIGWNVKKELATVYEVNTAPGLEGTTVNSYSQAFKDAYKNGK